jgi:hypothetical protein
MPLHIGECAGLINHHARRAQLVRHQPVHSAITTRGKRNGRIKVGGVRLIITALVDNEIYLISCSHIRRHIKGVADGVEDLLIGETRKAANRKAAKSNGRPAGKVREVFDRVSKLTRRQQEHIVNWVSAHVSQYEQNTPR